MQKLSNLNSGLGQFNLHLGRALAEMNRDFHLLFYVPAGFRDFGDVAYLEHKFMHRYISPVPRNAAIWHGTHQQSGYGPAAKQTGCVLTVHDLNFLYKYSGWKKSRALKKLQAQVNRCHQVVTISAFTAGELQQHVDLGGKQPHVIYNGNTLHTFPDAAPPEVMPGKPYLFTVGIFSERKNFHVLVEMMKKLPEYGLVMAGNANTAYGQQIREMIQKNNLEHTVLVTGEISDEDKFRYLKHSEGFVFPSKAEGFGLPVVEAMSLGKPVFISRNTSLPEIGGDDAFYWENFEPGYMAEVLRTGLMTFGRDKSAREKLIQRAAGFSWKSAAEQYLALYQDLL